jgi:hypothetical protein
MIDLQKVCHFKAPVTLKPQCCVSHSVGFVFIAADVHALSCWTHCSVSCRFAGGAV